MDTDWEFREALRREETDVEAEEVACILVGGGGLRLEGYGGVLGRDSYWLCILIWRGEFYGGEEGKFFRETRIFNGLLMA